MTKPNVIVATVVAAAVIVAAAVVLGHPYSPRIVVAMEVAEQDASVASNYEFFESDVEDGAEGEVVWQKRFAERHNRSAGCNVEAWEGGDGP